MRAVVVGCGSWGTAFAWLLKERVLPFVYWKAMLKGKEWLAKPEVDGVRRPLDRC